jgi:hypothetical protein
MEREGMTGVTVDTVGSLERSTTAGKGHDRTSLNLSDRWPWFDCMLLLMRVRGVSSNSTSYTSAP